MNNSTSDYITKYEFVNYYSTLGIKIVLPFPAYILNSFILIISSKKSFIKGRYKYFLFNLALAGICQSFCFGSCSVLGLLDLYDSDNLCALIAYLSLSSSAWMAFCLPLTPLCRYMNLYRKLKYVKIFTKRGCLTMCLVIALVSFSYSVLFLIDGNLGKLPSGHFGFQCNVILRNNPENPILTPMAIFIGSLLFFSVFSSCAYFNRKVSGVAR